MSIKSTKYITPSLRKHELKKISLNDFPSLGNTNTLIKKTEMNYKEKLKLFENNDNHDELPDGWIRLSTYKPSTKKESIYPDLTPTEEFIMMMDIVSKNRAEFYKSRMIEPPYVYVSPPEYEDIVDNDSTDSDIDMEDPEYEKIMNKFDK
jgi:hypothetical protein